MVLHPLAAPTPQGTYVLDSSLPAPSITLTEQTVEPEPQPTVEEEPA